MCVYVKADLDQLRDQLEEELEGKDELQRLLSKANSEAQVWIYLKLIKVDKSPLCIHAHALFLYFRSVLELAQKV